MADYRLSNEAKNELIRIHQYGIEKFKLFYCPIKFPGVVPVCFLNSLIK